MYESLLQQVSYNNENGGSDEKQIYSYLYNQGFKQKPNPSKKSDVALAMKTLISFNLVEKNNKNYFLTNDGKKFSKMLFEFTPNEETNNFLRMLGLQWKDIVWISKLVGLSTTVSLDYAPFVRLLNTLIDEGKVDDEWLIKWTLFKNDPKKETINVNNSEINKHSWNEIKFEKGHRDDYLPFIKMIEGHNFNETIFLRFMTRQSAFKKNVQLILCKCFDIPYLLARKKITTSFMTKEKNLNVIKTFFDNMTEEEFSTMYFNNKKYITARDEYTNINKYWLDEIKIFKKSFNGGYYISKIMQKFLMFLRNENFFDVKSLPINGEILLNIFVDDGSTIMEKFLIENSLDIKTETEITLSENNKIPFSEDDTKYFINNSADFIKDRSKLMEYKRTKKLGEISDATVFEYFINLMIYYIVKKVNKNIVFSELCNTHLDSSMYPDTTAPGGQPDGQFKLNNESYIIESTIIDSESMLIKNEYESIRRHLFSVTYSNDLAKKGLKGNLLFFSPMYTYNYLMSFFDIVDKSYQLKGEFISPKKDDNQFTANPYLIGDKLLFNKIKLNDKELLIRELKLKDEVDKPTIEKNYSNIIGEL